MKRTMQRALCAILVVALLAGAMPPLSQVLAATPETLTMQNDNIELTVSTKNGGFVVRTLEGDAITKDDNNKDLLYRRGQFDTSFASFLVTEGDVSTEYVFGNDYRYLGWTTSLSVTREENGIRAVWTVNDLVFTQLLEPILNQSSNEHGTIRISYSVENKQGTPIDVQVRLLLDTALGEQDFAYYELAQGATADESFICIEREMVLDQSTDYLPANFFAYDDYLNPTTAAYTIFDQSTEGLRPYRLAFGHWNNLAATVFDFVPDETLTFTNAYNRRYLTADSAMAIYYDLGSVAARSTSRQAVTYYGVDSKVRVKDSDRVRITITAPPGLQLNETKDAYLQPDSALATSMFEVITNITNLARSAASVLSEVTVAVYVDDGVVPLDGGGNELDPPPTSLQPHKVVIGNLQVGAMQQLTWKFRADVLANTSYRKLIFRAYDTSGADKRLLLENLIGASTTYILCPGAGGLPDLTFTSLGPDVIYNQGTRHLYLTGSGFGEYLSETSNYELRVRRKGAALDSYAVVPKSNIIYSTEKPGVLEVVLEQELAPGEYELKFAFDWSSPLGPGEIGSAALSFLVTEDPAYRNDSYGIVAIVKTDSAGKPVYKIKAFADEEGLQAYQDDEILLVFRGKFVLTREYIWPEWEIVACSAVATSGDTITVNGALDFENGNLQIYRQDTNTVMVEFNGDLYTSNSRTSVWSGNASLTPLLNGEDYGLIKYNQRGERVANKQPEKTISLVWPNIYGMLQTIGGFAVDLRYGEFGAMYEDEDCKELSGYVISFGGKLDLSFLIPGGSKEAEKLDQDDDTDVSESGDTVTVTPSEKAKEENEKNKVKPVGKINVADILYGNGDGYLGFNSQADLMLPKYVAALPAMGGRLSINTINGYKVGVLGKVETKKFGLEFELRVLNAPDSNVPVPDKLFFYMDGFEPGVNIDGVGAIWLTGAGGGIDKLYDTIFKTGVPPLTLLLSTSFDIVKVMSARADLSLSLRGFMMELSDVKLKNTDVIVLQQGTFGVNWEPSFYMQLSAMAEILGIIDGKAYLVVDDDFFEMFLRASVKIPKDVKVIGGMTVSNTDLGANNEKVWGAVSALGIRLGVTYYWGGDVSFGSGSNAAKPTYPQLLEMDGFAVGVDSVSGDTLYMAVGSNVSEGKPAQLLDSSAAERPGLFSVEPSLTSSLDKKNHSLNLGGSISDVALAFRMDGIVTEPESVIDIVEPGGQRYKLIVYDGSNPDTANTNAVVADDGQSTTLYVTITENLEGDWSVTTTDEADIVLYTIGEMPEVSSVTATTAGDRVSITWNGKMLDEAQISFYVTKDIGDGTGDGIGEMGRFIGALGGTDTDGTPRGIPKATGESLELELPADLPSGDYYLRMLVSKEDQLSYNLVAESEPGKPFKFYHHNSQQPNSPSSASLLNYGDGMFELQVAPPTGDFDGYSVSVYEQTPDGLAPTGLMGLGFAKDEGGAVPPMLLGGIYTTTDGQLLGLRSGKTYLAEVAAYRVSGDDVLFFSESVRSSATVLQEPTPPVVSFQPQAGTYKLVKKTAPTTDGEQTVTIPSFKQNDVQFTLRSDVPVTGYWSIDGSLWLDPSDPGSGATTVNGVREVSIDRWLCDGEHVLNFIGKDAEGDSFVFSQVFAVDTMPPRLMLSTPVNGTPFDADGSLSIEGIGDKGAVYTILVDGVTKVKDLRLEPSPAGLISYTLQGLNPSAASHIVTVIASDEVGHSNAVDVTVTNGGLAFIDSVDILVDGVSLGPDPRQRNIDASLLGKTVQLSLAANLASGAQVVINDERLVRWSAVAKAGSARVDSDGSLQLQAGSIGYVMGELMVAEGASINSALTFGAESYSEQQVNVVVTSTVGGVASGGGTYSPGMGITLKATPLPGYRFLGWTSSGWGAFANAGATTTVFTVPDQSVVVTARFAHKYDEEQPTDPTQPDPDEPTTEPTDPPDEPHEPTDPGMGVKVTKGNLASIRLPAGFAGNPNRIVAYYHDGDRELPVKISRVVDGQIVFLAPVDAIYYLKEDQTVYPDTLRHWARGAIEFAVARGLLGSVGSNRFDPQGSLTRAMFVTVLSRLDGADLRGYKAGRFSDVATGSWYAGPVAWAADIGITHGIGDGRFGPDLPITREMMATMLSNYLRIKDLALPAVRDPQEFADSDQVSTWAKGAMRTMNTAGIIAGADNMLSPKRLATRAECAAILQRLINSLLVLAEAQE